MEIYGCQIHAAPGQDPVSRYAVSGIYSAIFVGGSSDSGTTGTFVFILINNARLDKI